MLERKYSFDVDFTSQRSGKNYKGAFHMRRPDLSDMGSISASISRMNQGQAFVSDQFELLFTSIATISVCGEKVPSWWASVVEDDMDTSVIMHVSAQNVKAKELSLPFRSEETEEKESL